MPKVPAPPVADPAFLPTAREWVALMEGLLAGQQRFSFPIDPLVASPGPRRKDADPTKENLARLLRLRWRWTNDPTRQRALESTAALMRAIEEQPRGPQSNLIRPIHGLLKALDRRAPMVLGLSEEEFAKIPHDDLPFSGAASIDVELVELVERVITRVEALLPRARARAPRRPRALLIGVEEMRKALNAEGIQVRTADLNGALSAGEVDGAKKDLDRAHGPWVAQRSAVLTWARRRRERMTRGK